MFITLSYYNENEQIVGKTVPWEIKYTTKEKQLNQGDKLMLEGKYENAVSWYDSKIGEEGVKRKYVYPILRFYGDYTHRNSEKFEEYYEKLKTIDLQDIEKTYLESWGRS